MSLPSVEPLMTLPDNIYQIVLQSDQSVFAELCNALVIAWLDNDTPRNIWRVPLGDGEQGLSVQVKVMDAFDVAHQRSTPNVSLMFELDVRVPMTQVGRGVLNADNLRDAAASAAGLLDYASTLGMDQLWEAEGESVPFIVPNTIVQGEPVRAYRKVCVSTNKSVNTSTVNAALNTAMAEDSGTDVARPVSVVDAQFAAQRNMRLTAMIAITNIRSDYISVF